MAQRFSILTMDDDQAAKARELLGTTPLEQTGHYLTGHADDVTIERLIKSGLLLNIEPEEPLAERPTAPLINLDALADAAAARPVAGPPIAYGTVRVAAALTPARRNQLAGMGIRLDRKLGRSVYVAKIEPKRAPEAVPAWLDIGGYGIEGTLGPDLSLRVARRASEVAPTVAVPMSADVDFESSAVPALESGQLVAYDVTCHDDADLDQLERFVSTLANVHDLKRGEGRLRLSVHEGPSELALVDELGRIEEVGTVERYIAPDVHLSYAVQAALGPGTEISNLPWRGKGQVIGIADTGVDPQHPDLVGRVTVKLVAQPLTPRDPRGHGTHVASIAAGTGAASDGQLAGLAAQAHIFFQSLDDQNLKLQPGIGLKPLLREAYDNHVRVQNFSWGSAVKGRHTLDARDIDGFVYENPDLLVVVACGNDGEQELGPEASGRIGLASLASPATAKNCLAVGATCSPRKDGPYAGLTWKSYDGRLPAPTLPPMSDLPLTGDPNVVAALSSRGPSDDGRIKPDLLAPGVGVAAARSFDCTPSKPFPGYSDHYHYATGTSMAAPLVAGAAVVVRQYFVEERAHTPSAALLKATLINGASWIRGEVWEDPAIGLPNFHQGFGRLVLSNAIPLPGAAFRLEFSDVANSSPEALVDSNAAKSRWRRKLTVKAGHPLTVTLVWTDPPARGLQHELDLVVVSPSARLHTGNDGLRRPAYESRDIRNNVEQVFVAEPEPGEWAVTVTARNTFLGPQGFAIAMTGDFQV